MPYIHCYVALIIMKIKSLINLYSDKGMRTERQTFVKGKEYHYYAEDSRTNQRLVEPEKGERVCFTDDEFRRYFKP